MGSVEVARHLDQQHLGEGSAVIQQQRVCSKRRRPYPHEEQVQPRCAPPPRRRQRPAELATPQDAEEEEDEEQEEWEDGDDDSDYQQDDGNQEEEGEEDEEEEETAPPAKQRRQRQQQQANSKQRQPSETAGGVSPRSGSGGGGGGGAVGWGGGRNAGDHECLVCGKKFAKACKLVRHAATHTGEKPFVCGEEGCSKAFATKDKLKRHALSHARRKAGLSASVGSAARREAETRQNAAAFAAKAAAAGVSLELPLGMRTATATTAPLLEASRMERERAVGGGGGGDGGGGEGWKHSCPTCGRNFLDNYHLKRHVKAIHEGPRPYRCEHPVAAPTAAAGAAVAATGAPAAAAPTAFTAAAPSPAASSTAAVAVAGATAAAARVSAGAERDREEVAIDGLAKDRATACVSGGKHVRGGDAVREESTAPAGEGRALREGDAGGLCREDAAEESKQRGRVFGVCGAAFAKKWQLREHLFAEHGQTKFNSRQHQCSHAGCGRVFDRPSKLAAHMKTHKARFVCEFEGCGAAFVLASGLNLHLKEEHPFRCGVCDKVFDREDKMQLHQGTHNRAGDGGFIRPYDCNVPGCGKSFTEKRNLNAHRRTRHTEGGRKRFRCEVGGCTMAFAHRHTLNKHVKREHDNASSTTGCARKTGNNKKNGNNDHNNGGGFPGAGDLRANPTATPHRHEEDPLPVSTAGATLSTIGGPRGAGVAPQARKPEAEEDSRAGKGGTADETT